ncbi:response regulator [Flavivirga eckloniae]|uniref:DNA-binding response regulator n=1 Tax=Flavivirga eckloniae TaxID=1803846 RepID=A0A2K9PRI6_9FLAO|nr:response regulator [Flavivirga eckloniae]AUP79680.1 DNA-binding response regulator [Flavivirga eckloniae]
MTKAHNVLIIDDHIAIIESYERAFSYLSSNADFVFEIDTATSCDNALLKIEKSLKSDPYDLIFLDISLPPSKDGKILCGEDLGKRIRQLLSDTRIIVSTHHNNNYRINNIFNSINPEGFLIKSEAGFSNFVDAIKAILNNSPYYTKTVLELLRKSLMNNFNLDETDRQLLYELSKGTKMKDLPNTINLSIGGIERRKRLLKQTFNTTRESDLVLIKAAQEYGFL